MILRFLASPLMKVSKEGPREKCAREGHELSFGCAGLEVTVRHQERCLEVAGIYRSRKKSGLKKNVLYIRSS